LNKINEPDDECPGVFFYEILSEFLEDLIESSQVTSADSLCQLEVRHERFAKLRVAECGLVRNLTQQELNNNSEFLGLIKKLFIHCSTDAGFLFSFTICLNPTASFCGAFLRA